jgi:hypothetical protein
MNSNLLRLRPKDSSPEEFKKAWDNSGYVLEALYKLLEEQMATNNKVNKDDFDCPNHYAKLAYQAGYSNALEMVKDLLPASAKPM